MYLQHFRLAQAPFALTPNLSMYCHLSQHEEAMQVLKYGLSQGECLMKVVGEVGLGKTLLCRQMLNTLGDEYVTCYIFNPCLSGDDILKAVSQDLGLPVPEDATRFTLIEALSAELLKQHEAHRRVVLLVDEAHLLNDEAMEVMRLLTNLETDSSKLLQIILVGQPELDARLATPQLRQIQQRIAYSCYLHALDPEHTQSYLMRRLLAAGHCHGQVFTKAAVKALNRYAKGVPRIINILCNKAMLIACSRGDQMVSLQDMKKAIKDSVSLIDTTTHYGATSKHYGLLTAVSLVTFGVVAGLMYLLFQR